MKFSGLLKQEEDVSKGDKTVRLICYHGCSEFSVMGFSRGVAVTNC
jgi:hypothetical protein